jgi:anti-anti-sigma factor
MTPLALSHRRLSGVCVVSVAGELDTSNHAQVEAYLGQARLEPADQVVLDLGGLTFMDSNGLRVLLNVHQECLRFGGALLLAALQPPPARLLHITGVETRVAIYGSVEQAVAVALEAAQTGS